MAQPIQLREFWTEADLDELPSDGQRYEIVDGSLLVTPPPGGDHQTMESNLMFALRLAAPRGWRVVCEVGMRAPGSNFIPDVVVLYPASRKGEVWFDKTDTALVVEIASRATVTTDRFLKQVKYAQAGIPAYWRVERDGSVTVLTLREGQYEVTATLEPGGSLTLDWPFPVTLTTEALLEGL